MLMLAVIVSACSSERDREGDVLYNNGDYSGALDAYNEYLEARPNDLEVIYRRGRTYEQLGDEDNALKNYRLVISKDKEHAKAHSGVAGYYYRQKDYENALYHYQRSIEKDKANAVNFLQKGKCNQKLGKLKEALKDYNNAIGIDDSNGEFYVARGSLRLVMNQRNQACNDLKIAKGLGAESADKIISQYCR